MRGNRSYSTHRKLKCDGLSQCFLTFFGFVHPLPSTAAFPFTPLRMYLLRDNNHLTAAFYCWVWFFVHDLHPLSSSFKDSRIRISCQGMGSYESNKCSHPMYFNERRHRTSKLQTQWTLGCDSKHVLAVDDSWRHFRLLNSIFFENWLCSWSRKKQSYFTIGSIF